ncbi:MAG: hypothetical protein H0X30_15965 [Anaerolineae bacterium]|nr:hypothetical protein [Anaerolineae bacterium]
MAKRKTTKRKPIKRVTRHFQLRIGQEYPIDAHVQEILEFKKSKRSEVTAIRDGVRLLWALENNDLSVLFEMFPQYQSQFTPSTADALAQFMEILRHQQPALTPLIEQSTGPKQLPAPNFAMPVFEEDDEPTVLIRASTSNDSALNFVTALRNMQ